MLGKILKYDILADYKKFGFMYLGMAITSILIRIISILLDKVGRFTAIQIIGSIVTGMFALISICSFLLVFVIAIVRFYKNLMRDEGYLMHTLPVKTWQLILSKLLATYIWSIITTIVFAISISIVMWDFTWLFDIFREFGALKAELIAAGGNGLIWFLWYILIAVILSPFMFMSQVYFSFSIGNLVNKGKLGISILVYFGTYIVIQIIAVITMVIMMFSSGFVDEAVSMTITDAEAFNFLNPMFTAVMIISVGISIIFYAISNVIFTKKLNLE